MSPRQGMRLVDAGRIEFHSWDESDRFWCRAVARGRIVARVDDGTRGPYACWVHLVEHPDLPPGQVYAIFSNRLHSRIYRCSPEAARAAIQDHGVFNLV